jgi:hypothetical protein
MLIFISLPPNAYNYTVQILSFEQQTPAIFLSIGSCRRKPKSEKEVQNR